MKRTAALFLTILAVFLLSATGFPASDQFGERIYQTGKLKPLDSKSSLKVGNKAPDFTLPSLSGKKVSLKDFAGKKNVVISFVPAA